MLFFSFIAFYTSNIETLKTEKNGHNTKSLETEKHQR